MKITACPAGLIIIAIILGFLAFYVNVQGLTVCATGAAGFALGAATIMIAVDTIEA